MKAAERLSVLFTDLKVKPKRPPKTDTNRLGDSPSTASRR